MKPEQLAEAGLVCGPAGYARLVRFVELLLAENEKINLTGIREPEKVWPLHICDALSAAHLIAAKGMRRFVDLGSGGGLPGIPLACVREDIDVTLLDATVKKTAAIDRIIAGIELKNARTLTGRAELLARDAAVRETFDVVLARAVGPLERLLEFAAGLVRPAGQVWCFKSVQAAEAEIHAARRVAHLCTLSNVRTHAYRLPGEHGERVIVIYDKHGPLRAELPRPPWHAKKKPLA